MWFSWWVFHIFHWLYTLNVIILKFSWIANWVGLISFETKLFSLIFIFEKWTNSATSHAWRAFPGEDCGSVVFRELWTGTGSALSLWTLPPREVTAQLGAAGFRCGEQIYREVVSLLTWQAAFGLGKCGLLELSVQIQLSREKQTGLFRAPLRGPRWSGQKGTFREKWRTLGHVQSHTQHFTL